MSQFKFGKPAELSRTAFIETFGAIYEHSSWIAERTYDKDLNSLDANIETLQGAMAAVFLAASKEEQLGVINAHPDLAGRAARAGALTAESTSEQASAGIDSLSDTEFAEFTQLNDAYKARFNFPFIMAVRGSNKHAILAGFRERLKNSPEQEFARAITEINKIAGFRLADL